MASRRDDGDRRAFTLAVVASLVLSPIVWEHYFALLVAPLALARPRFDRYWLVFALGFIWCPGPPLHPSALEVAVSLAALGTIAYGCLRPDSTQSKRGAARVTGALRAPRPAHTT